MKISLVLLAPIISIVILNYALDISFYKAYNEISTEKSARNGIKKSIINPTISEEVHLNQLRLLDDNLGNILDSFILNKPTSNSFDTNFIIIDVCNYNWKVGEKCKIEDTMILILTLSNDTSFVLSSKKEGFFSYKNVCVFVSGILHPDLFEKLNKEKAFKYEGSASSVIKVVSNEDYSWDFYYINNKFVCIEEP
jgi:hypothetical protein